jgi:hypothetical protein
MQEQKGSTLMPECGEQRQRKEREKDRGEEREKKKDGRDH